MGGKVRTNIALLSFALLAFLAFGKSLWAEPARELDELVKWYALNYQDRHQDVALIARVSHFESDAGNREAFLAALGGLKNDDEFSRNVAALAGFFRTPEVMDLLVAKLKESDDRLRRELLYAMLNFRPDIVPDKEILLDLLRSGDREVKIRALYVTRQGWGRGGAEVYAAAFDNPDLRVRQTAFALAKATGAPVLAQARQWLVGYIANAPQEELGVTWWQVTLTRWDVLACVDYLEVAYGIGQQVVPDGIPDTVGTRIRRLLDLTDQIDKITAKVREEYSGGNREGLVEEGGRK